MVEPSIHATYAFQGEHGIESRTFVGSMRAFALFLQRKSQELPQEDVAEGWLRGPPYLFQLDCVRVVLHEASVEEVPEMVAWLTSSPRPGTGAAATRFSIEKLEFEGIRLEHHNWPILMSPAVPSLLGHLLGRGSVTSLHLCTIWWPDQCSQLIQSVSDHSRTLKEFVVTLFSPHLGQYDMYPAYRALAETIPRMQSLEQFRLLEGSCVDIGNSQSILRAALSPETAPSRLSLLHLSGLQLTGSEPRSLEALATNPSLKDLQLHGYFPKQTIAVLASVLKTNRTLQWLELWNTADDFEYNAFGEAIAVNQTLVFLALGCYHFPDSAVLSLSIGLRRNNTLKVLLLDGWTGLDRQALQPMIETVQHHNDTVECVRIPMHLKLEQSLLDSVCTFHGPFRSACQALVVEGTGTTKDASRAAAFQRWWPLLGSTHPKIKATVLFCLLRSRAELASQSLRTASTSSTRKRDRG